MLLKTAKIITVSSLVLAGNEFRELEPTNQWYAHREDRPASNYARLIGANTVAISFQ